MRRNSKNSTNLIAVSLISALMVLWLGSRYLSDAHTQYSGAMQLQRSVAPETTLFEIAQSLDHERSVIQDILIKSEDVYDGQLDKLDEISKSTRQLFIRAQNEIKKSRPRGSEKIQYQYSDESIDKLIEDLNDKFERISITNTLIVSQVYIPHAARDETIRMPLYDAYSNLIFAVNNLRFRAQVLPEFNYSGVLATQDAKSSIWNAAESIHQTSTLIRSYLQKSEVSAIATLNRENLALRIFQENERAKQSVSNLHAMVQGNVITGEFAAAINDLKTHYEGAFSDYVKKLSIAVSNGSEPSVSLAESEALTTNIHNSIRSLTKIALGTTLERANSIHAAATETLLVNALLVLLCATMAYGSYRISKRIQYQADHDDLTGICNRRRFSELLNTIHRKTGVENQEKLVLLTLDLNGFKSINDTMGHAAGDKLLVRTAQRMNSLLQEGMVIARTGGDEFAIAYTTKTPEKTYNFACELRDAFDQPFKIDNSSIRIDPSVGYSVYPDDAKTIEELQITSDFAMFSAKQTDDKKVQPYDRKIAEQFEKRAATEKDLKHAIENNELELHYQPQFNLELNRANAVEALVRWNHPTRGMVPPFEFIEIAEECGLMPAIGNWVLNEACRQAGVWNNNENLSIRVAINVSVHQLMHAEFVDSVIESMKQHNVSPDWLELEITESVIIGDVNWIVSCLKKLKEAGLKIALDDFGTGYSSLSQLQNLPLDTLKIDRSFISSIDDKTSNMRSVTATIASIANIYNLETVAEGIETVEQLQAVAKLGINVAQGYYYSKPLPSSELVQAIESINRQAAADGSLIHTTTLKRAA